MAHFTTFQIFDNFGTQGKNHEVPNRCCVRGRGTCCQPRPGPRMADVEGQEPEKVQARGGGLPPIRLGVQLQGGDGTQQQICPGTHLLHHGHEPVRRHGTQFRNLDLYKRGLR